MPAVDWRRCPEAGEDASAPRVGLPRFKLVAKSCSFSNKNCETLSYNVAAFRFVEIGVESLFNWIEEKTGIQRASKVRSYNGLLVHVFGRLAAAMWLLLAKAQSA